MRTISLQSIFEVLESSVFEGLALTGSGLESVLAIASEQAVSLDLGINHLGAEDIAAVVQKVYSITLEPDRNGRSERDIALLVYVHFLIKNRVPIEPFINLDTDRHRFKWTVKFLSRESRFSQKLSVNRKSREDINASVEILEFRSRASVASAKSAVAFPKSSKILTRLAPVFASQLPISRERASPAFHRNRTEAQLPALLG